MMNLVNVEKSLKHWLKNKVTVTTATVVGFLIMGTVSFGAQETEEAINSNRTVIVDSNSNTNYRVDNGKKVEVSGNNATAIEASGKFTITNNGSIIAKGGNEANNAINVSNITDDSTITNNGLISAQVENGGSASAISVVGTIAAGKTLTITNSSSGVIESKREGNSEGLSARGTININATGGKVVFINKGKIAVDKGVAIYTTSSGEITNDGTIELSGNSIAVNNHGGTVTNTNNGIIKITDKTKAELEKENFDSNSLFIGATKVENKGMIISKDKVALHNSNNVYLSGNLTTQVINNRGKETGAITLGKIETKISSQSNEAIQLDVLNIVGKVGVLTEKDDLSKTIEIKNTNINLDKNGIFSVGGLAQDWDDTLNKQVDKKISGTLSIEGKNVNKATDGDAVELLYGSTLNLKDVNFNGGISEKDGEGNLNILGNTYINGKIGVSKINVGTGTKAVGSDKLTLVSTSSFTKDTTLTNGTTGTTVFEIGVNGENALNNSDKKVTVIGNVDFDTSNLTVDTTVNLKGQADNNLTQMEYENITDGIYTTNYNEGNKTLEVKYNKTLSGNTALDSVNNILQSVNNKLNNADKAERVNQVDEIYSGNIYSETTRAMYDNLKMNEEAILSLGRTANLGEVTTHGKALFSKDKYDREGQFNSFDAKVETSGLLAGVEYGLSENTSIGTVFSGSKQDVKINNGKSDADLFYFGVYGNKTYGNYDFTAGLGYQFGKYDSKYNIGNLYGKDKYDSQAFNGYVQGKYIANFEDGLSIQPKVKLGYTYLKQDDAKDANFGVSDAEITTYDTEVGVDVVKSVQFEKSKLDVTFGTSYVRTMGDTDKEFKLSTVKGSANILGAELDENVIKFNLGAEVGNENGFFYNGGFTYEFGGNDTKAYGVNAGVGYKF